MAMSNEYDDFVIQRKIDRFSRLLESEEGAQRRATLTQLLEEERAKIDGASQNSEA